MSILLKILPARLSNNLRQRNEKSKVFFVNASLSFAIKGVNIFVSFLTVPLVLSFLDKTQYGIWLTLTAIISWFSLFDLGFGNGLRNRLTLSLAKKNLVESKTYVSTTYAALSVIFGTLLIVFFIIHHFINWTKVFNAPVGLQYQLNLAVLYAVGFLFMQFVLRLVNTVLLSFQKSAVADGSNAIGQVCVLIGLYICKLLHADALSSVALIYSAVPVVIFLLVSLVLYNGEYKGVSPSLSFVKIEYVKSLLDLGLRFFVIQIASLVIYATDNFLISQLFGPADVTTYNIAYKYLSISTILFSIILSPFWSLVTRSYAEKDFDWIRRAMKKIMLTWAILVSITLIQLIFSKFIYKVWTHNKVVVPFSLTATLALYYIIVMWGNIFSNFLNGVGKIKLQLLFASISMVINIPLAILFIKVFHLGILGIPLSVIILTAVVSLFSYIQYHKIVSSTATGLWAK